MQFQLRSDFIRVVLIWKQELDCLEPGLRGGFEALDERNFVELQSEIGGEFRHDASIH
jgi:hypothetical protein